jgi:nucleoside phosphorylase
MKNPYIVGSFVHGSDFYGRQNLTDELLDERHQCTYLVGNRRSGKTSLLHHLETRECQANNAIIYLNLQATESNPVKMGEYIVSQVKRKARHLPYLAGVNFGKSGDVCDVVTELAEEAERNQFSVLLLWDEAEELLDLKPDCLKRLRAAFQHTIAMRTILSTTKRLSVLNDLCRTWKTSPFMSGFTTRYISPLTEQEATQLICQTNNPEGQVRVEADLLDEIMANTGNHPFLIQLLCDRLYQANGKLHPISEDDLIVDDQLSDFFQIDYDALSPSEQAILNELAAKTGAKENEIEQALLINPDQLRSYLHGLSQLGFVRYMSLRGEYEISNHFLLTWLKMGHFKKNRFIVSDQASLETIKAGDAGSENAAFQRRDCPVILLVTVTKTETQALLEVISRATCQPWQRKYFGNKTYYALGKLGGAELVMVQSEMGAATSGGAILTVSKAIEAITPAAVIMVGIAFGVQPKSDTNPKGQSLGDVLVAKQIMAYEPGKVKGKFIPRGDRVKCSLVLLDKFRTGELDWVGSKTIEGSPASVHIGLMLSGEKLIADERLRARLLKLEPEAIGGDMEGVGLYAAASDAKVDWILVKAICDWADGNKNDIAQPLAAHNAADFVRHVIELGGWEAQSRNNSMLTSQSTISKTLSTD